MQQCNNQNPPDFTSAAYEEERQPFLDAGLTEQQAADVLLHQWNLKLDRDRRDTERQEEQAAIAAVEEAAHEADEQQQREEEKAQQLKEEKKKNKAKFAPIPDVLVSSEPIVLPSQVAVRKIQQHKFCELWYFTNEGLDIADASLSYATDNDSLSLVPSTDGTPMLIPTVATREKANITQDENLSMEQFGQATI